MDRPSQTWFSRKEVIAILDIDARLFRHYVEIGLFPKPYKRGRRALYWTEDDITSMIHAEKNKKRFLSRLLKRNAAKGKGEKT